MTLDEVRHFYSEEVRWAAPLRSRAVVDAFARVPREDFVGPGPWQIALADLSMGARYTTTDSADARHVYHNVPIAIDPSRHLINGQPATLGRWIDELDLRSGDRVFHLGCGPGYYTAIMAEIVGPAGEIVASEIDEQLAHQAGNSLAGYSHVTVRAGNGLNINPGLCDAMLINAGVTRPLPAWLDMLKDKGRIIVPLTVPLGPTLSKGVVLKITREADKFIAHAIGFAVIYTCAGGRDAESEAALGKAIATGALTKTTTIRRDLHAPGETCVFHAGGVCFTAAS